MKHGDSKAMLEVANRVRVYVQRNTCCVDTGVEVAMVVLATFVLDHCDHQAEPAAAELERRVKLIAEQIRDRTIAMHLPESERH
jgi:hypothetical protein